MKDNGDKVINWMRGSGITKTISISKIIKIIPSRKNRSENGRRAELLGSKPHSKGDVFSRSLDVRRFKVHAAPHVAPLSKNEIDSAVSITDIRRK